MKNPELDAIARELPRGTDYQIDFIETSTNRPAHYIASAGVSGARPSVTPELLLKPLG